MFDPTDPFPPVVYYTVDSDQPTYRHEFVRSPVLTQSDGLCHARNSPFVSRWIQESQSLWRVYLHTQPSPVAPWTDYTVGPLEAHLYVCITVEDGKWFNGLFPGDAKYTFSEVTASGVPICPGCLIVSQSDAPVALFCSPEELRSGIVTP